MHVEGFEIANTYVGNILPEDMYTIECKYTLKSTQFTLETEILDKTGEIYKQSLRPSNETGDAFPYTAGYDSQNIVLPGGITRD